MNTKLPETIETYFQQTAAEAHAEVAALFAPEAVIVDEGEDEEIVGRDAIHQWMIELAAKYKTSIDVTAYEEVGGQGIVTTLVSGNFPGSPAEFVYRFDLQDDGQIARLVMEFAGFK